MLLIRNPLATSYARPSDLKTTLVTPSMYSVTEWFVYPKEPGR